MKKRRNNIAGYTLVELIVVMVIIGTLLAIAALPFSQWLVKNGIESQTRQLLTDLQDARARAVYSKRPTRVTFNSLSYVIEQAGTDFDISFATATTITTVAAKYNLTRDDGSVLAGTQIIFDGYGAANTFLSVMANPTNSGAMFDCVIIDVARSALGGMASGSCVTR